MKNTRTEPMVDSNGWHTFLLRQKLQRTEPMIDFTSDGVLESRIETDNVENRVVEVTDQHIGEGREGSCSRCPVALAVGEMLRADPLPWMEGITDWKVEVQTSGVMVSNLDLPHSPFCSHAALPEEGKVFIDEYDDGLWTNQKLAWKSGDSEGLNGSFELELDFSPVRHYSLKGAKRD